ncbi:MAG: hypothetical protein ABUT20_38850 [Bacteroidota bacterium]
MKETFELNKLGLAPLQINEMLEIEGGDSFWIWLAQQAIQNWDDIKKGAIAGWNSVK